MTCSTCRGLTYVRRCEFACPDDCRDHSTACPACVPDPFADLYGQHSNEPGPRPRIDLDAWTTKIPPTTPTRKAPMPAQQPTRSPGLDRIRRAEMDDLVTRLRAARRASAPMILTARETDLVADVFDLNAEADQ